MTKFQGNEKQTIPCLTDKSSEEKREAYIIP